MILAHYIEKWASLSDKEETERIIKTLERLRAKAKGHKKDEYDRKIQNAKDYYKSKYGKSFKTGRLRLPKISPAMQRTGIITALTALPIAIHYAEKKLRARRSARQAKMI